MNKTILVALMLFVGCSSQNEKRLKVAASAVPHAEILESIQEDLKTQGVDLDIIVTDDFNMPNRALAGKEIDANFFQHLPFLEEQIKQFQYPIKSIASIELEPMGVYSKRISALSDLSDNSTVAIPNDPTNEGRALIFLHDQEIIQLDNPHNLAATPLNIISNPKQLSFIEVDAAMLPRTLDEVDIALINTNYALQAKLSPKNALVLESKDSPYVNVLVVREGDENRPDIQALQKALTSDTTKEFILQKYHGAIIPTF